MGSRQPASLKKPFFLLVFMVFSNSCTNSPNNNPYALVANYASNPSNSDSESSSPNINQDQFYIALVNIGVGANNNTPNGIPNVLGSQSPSPAGNGNQDTNGVAQAIIYFDTNQSTAPISTRCDISPATATQASKPCKCQFQWQEINPFLGGASTIPHDVLTPVTLVQPSIVVCNAPSLYTTSIPANTPITIRIVPDQNNPDFGFFSTNTYTYIAKSTATGGSFNDATGNVFDDIMHYACYSTVKRGITLQSFTNTKTNNTTGNTVEDVFGTKFCVDTLRGGSSGPNCKSLPGVLYSSQAGNYFNLYIRSQEAGDINLFNSSFTCPTVQEPLVPTLSRANANSVWPQDKTFALSVQSAGIFTYGVDAQIMLSDGTPSSASTTCASQGNGAAGANANSSTNNITVSCLGFAAPANADGTCPTIKISGAQVPTYRLRRYGALMPRIYDTTGYPAPTAQAFDTIYVLDRPVLNPSRPSSEPTQYTMYGPKPCPFSYFDFRNVTEQIGYNPVSLQYGSSLATGGYAFSGNPRWLGKNIDGIQFPNSDYGINGIPSCSTTFPIFNKTDSQIQVLLTTINAQATFVPNINTIISFKTKSVYVRPTPPFVPHYEEDLSFRACAPQATRFQDAPLHFARDPASGNIAWCSESYPTQNPYVSSVDPADFPLSSNPNGNLVVASGQVANYTSHVAKNSISGACNATPITSTAVRAACAGASLSSNTLLTYVYPPLNPPYIGYACHNASIPWEVGDPSGSFNTSMTCDRTLSYTPNSAGWTTPPLLGDALQIESAIASDKSYMCLITYDQNGGKTGISSPSDGCCNAASVYLKTIATSTSTILGAHLEPSRVASGSGAGTNICGSPNY